MDHLVLFWLSTELKTICIHHSSSHINRPKGCHDQLNCPRINLSPDETRPIQNGKGVSFITFSTSSLLELIEQSIDLVHLAA